MVKEQKTDTIAIKYQRTQGGNSLSIKEEKNYESNTRDKTNLDQINNKYLLLL